MPKPHPVVSIIELDAVHGGAESFPPIVHGEWWEHQFNTPRGRVDVAGTPSIEGDRVTFRDILVYPNGGERFELGHRDMANIRSQVADYARESGFREMGYEYYRSSGANPGRTVSSVMDLTTGRTTEMNVGGRSTTLSGGLIPGEAMLEVGSRWAGEIVRDPVGSARGAAGAIGTVALGTGLVENLARDGVLPEGLGEAVAPFNHAVGAVTAPFAIGGGQINSTVRDLTGSHTAGFVADTGANALAYWGAGAVAGAPGVALLGTVQGLDYLANRSDFAVAGRTANTYLNDLGIDTSPNTFGHALATEFRSGTSGIMTNVPETNAALSTFGQLYTSQIESGANLALTTRNGWGAADAGAQDRLLALRDVSLGAARDPNVTGGAVFFPDGTQGNWVDPAYAAATQNLVNNHGYGADYLGNMTRDEVIHLSNNPGNGLEPIQTNTPSTLEPTNGQLAEQQSYTPETQVAQYDPPAEEQTYTADEGSSYA